jgi:hypothetical protein
MIPRRADNRLQPYAIARRKDVGPMAALLEVLGLILAVPGAIAALVEIWARRAASRRPSRTHTRRLDIDLHLSIRRS